jgi:hypothetical protein
MASASRSEIVRTVLFPVTEKAILIDSTAVGDPVEVFSVDPEGVVYALNPERNDVSTLVLLI